MSALDERLVEKGARALFALRALDGMKPPSNAWDLVPAEDQDDYRYEARAVLKAVGVGTVPSPDDGPFTHLRGTGDDYWDAANSVRLCDSCEKNIGVGAGADAGDRACGVCGQHDAPYIYPALARVPSPDESSRAVEVAGKSGEGVLEDAPPATVRELVDESRSRAESMEAAGEKVVDALRGSPDDGEARRWESDGERYAAISDAMKGCEQGIRSLYGTVPFDEFFDRMGPSLYYAAARVVEARVSQHGEREAEAERDDLERALLAANEGAAHFMARESRLREAAQALCDAVLQVRVNEGRASWDAMEIARSKLLTELRSDCEGGEG